jgi:hypothetical protein
MSGLLRTLIASMRSYDTFIFWSKLSNFSRLSCLQRVRIIAEAQGIKLSCYQVINDDYTDDLMMQQNWRHIADSTFLNMIRLFLSIRSVPNSVIPRIVHQRYLVLRHKYVCNGVLKYTVINKSAPVLQVYVEQVFNATSMPWSLPEGACSSHELINIHMYAYI